MKSNGLNMVVAPLSAQSEHPTLKQLESCYIAHILGINKGNITHAAEVLGVTRRTLQRKLSRGLELDSTLSVNTIELNLSDPAQTSSAQLHSALIITALAQL